MDEFAVVVEHVSKSFGALKANTDISLHIKKGEIRALLGENGAGKSTLMKMLFGLYKIDEGKVYLDGEQLPDTFSPTYVINKGLSLVPQHFMLVDAFSVAENILLGQESKIGKTWFNKKKAENEIVHLCEEYGINLNPSAVVSSLSLGEKQKIEILKALYRNSKIIILDEPTTVLTPQETAELFQLLKGLKEKGKTIIIIAHKLSEVMTIADTITIMRMGRKIKTINKVDTSVNELAELMVGRSIKQTQVLAKKIEECEKPIFSLNNISTRKVGDRCNLKGISLDLYKGKIIGIAGIDGNGQTDLLEVMAGIKSVNGSVTIDGVNKNKSVSKEILKLGIGVIPEDRLTQGLILEFSMKENLMLSCRHEKEFVNYGILNKKKITDYAYAKMEEYDIRPRNINTLCKFASGGNQQKVVIARELNRPNLNIVVASQPTRGLDVGAIEFAHETLLKLRHQGKAVMLISSDLDEIMSLSDYIAVIHDGKIVECRMADDFTREQIGLCMGGEKITQEVG